jgi:hypothetical protein
VISLTGNVFVGDEVTSLKILWFLKDKLETPYVVSYEIHGKGSISNIGRTSGLWNTMGGSGLESRLQAVRAA